MDNLKKQQYRFVTSTVIKPDHPDFEGHFPGNPLLPAVSQIKLILDAIECFLNEKIVFSLMRDCKFLQPIKPNARLEVALNPEDHYEFRWKISCENSIYSLGTIKVERVKKN